MTTLTKSIFQIDICRSPRDAEDHFYASFPIVASMPDTEHQEYEPVSQRAINALNECGIYTYYDVYCAPQIALSDEQHVDECIENVLGLGPKNLHAIMENLTRLGWEHQAQTEAKRPMKIAACAAEAADEVSEPVVDEATLYYVIGTELVGPNAAQEKGRFDCYEIATEPAMKNLSHEVITEGWAGTTNDISVTAHGVFDTYGEAEAKILSILGDDHREEEVREAGNVITRFTIGAYAAMSAEYSVEWAGDAIDEVDADETDEDIDARVTVLEKQAIEETETRLDADRVRKAMQERRDFLKEEDEDEA